MVKRTLVFGSPAYLHTQNDQLVVQYPEEERRKTVPIEDIGFVVLEDRQITISNGLLGKLTQNNVAIVNCDERHLPVGLHLPLSGHTEHHERMKAQLESSLPLRKNLWQQTVQAKIRNQAYHLEENAVPISNMLQWARSVTSGDTQNHEARAAAYYWPRIFGVDDFQRRRHGDPPNNLLNYGYAILRAVCARSIVGSGLLPILGIHHSNKYNNYCLADDVMEPYRPFVDSIVADILMEGCDVAELTTEIKARLLSVPAMDVMIEEKKSPLMIAMSRTTSSLSDCFLGVSRKVLYPVYV